MRCAAACVLAAFSLAVVAAPLAETAQAFQALRAGRTLEAEQHFSAAELQASDAPARAALQAERCVLQVQGSAERPSCTALAAALGGSDLPPRTRFLAHEALATEAHALGLSDAALDHRLAALAAAEAIGTSDPRWAALASLAQQLRAQGQTVAAAYFGKQALAAIEAMRSDAEAQAASAERGFLNDRLEVHRQVAEGLVADGRIDEALRVLALLKEEEFLEFVQRRRGWIDDGLQAGLEEAERWMDARWTSVAAATPAPANTGPVSRDLLLRGGAVAPNEAAWIALARVALRDMEAGGLTASTPVARALRMPPLAADQVLRVYAIAGLTHLTLVFEMPTWVQAQSIPWPRRSLEREIGATLAALGRGEDAGPRLQALYDRLGRPIADAARRRGAQRIVLVGDGALRYLPFAALYDGSLYLGERYVLSQQVRSLAPTARELATSVPLLLAVGVSRSLPGQRALPGVAREVCAIVAGPVHGLAAADPACPGAGVVPGEGWLNEQFTHRRLSSATAAAATAARSGRGAMLHIGTHFDLRPGQMNKSSLQLGDGERLSLELLAQMDFRGHDLVTLSACETGVGGAEDADGHEIEGLNLLLVRRGARAVLGSLWRVDDNSTSFLMAAFYGELARADPAQALQRAQAAVRVRPGWESPFHWAGFFLTTRP